LFSRWATPIRLSGESCGASVGVRDFSAQRFANHLLFPAHIFGIVMIIR
jgi:hypothetical protein